MKKNFTLLFSAVSILTIAFSFSSCKSCNKKNETTEAVKADTSQIAPVTPHTIDLPHGDTSLIPAFSKLLDEAFAASAKKDYNALAPLLVYRGPDEKKMGYEVFDAKNKFDKNVVRITADVFNKWNKDVDAKEYPRVFELPQPDGRKMLVMEVIFTSKKNFDRKFFGFLEINNEWKIADVTSYL